MELPRCTSIDSAICELCYTEKSWNIEVEGYVRELEIKYNCRLEAGVPANSPLWTEYNQFLNKYKVPCFIFNYDDLVVAVCKNHLKDILSELCQKS